MHDVICDVIMTSLPVHDSESILCIVVNCSRYEKSYKQVEGMVILNLFIDYHYKSIVSSIRAKHVLTLHLSTANCRRSSLLAAAARTLLQVM